MWQVPVVILGIAVSQSVPYFLVFAVSQSVPYFPCCFSGKLLLLLHILKEILTVGRVYLYIVNMEDNTLVVVKYSKFITSAKHEVVTALSGFGVTNSRISQQPEYYSVYYIQRNRYLFFIL